MFGAKAHEVAPDGRLLRCGRAPQPRWRAGAACPKAFPTSRSACEPRRRGHMRSAGRLHAREGRRARRSALRRRSASRKRRLTRPLQRLGRSRYPSRAEASRSGIARSRYPPHPESRREPRDLFRHGDHLPARERGDERWAARSPARGSAIVGARLLDFVDDPKQHERSYIVSTQV
jgi:hypothetical protein